MAHPQRHFFNNKFVCHPEIDKEKKILKFIIFDPLNNVHIQEHYEEAFIDYYSAPDLILPYMDGDTTKDEFLRYSRTTFKNLRLIDCEELFPNDPITVVFSFDEMIYQWIGYDDPFHYSDVPLGKYSGLTIEGIEARRKKKWNLGPFKRTEPDYVI